MIGGLIVTHGRLAIELLNAAEKIVGEIHHKLRPSLWAGTTMLTRQPDPSAKRSTRLTPDGVLILTDMFGGTPTNIASTYLDPGKVEVITGVNLPMLIKFVQIDEGQTLAAAAKLIREPGRAASILRVNCLPPRNSNMKEREVVIGHRLGLHARAAAKLVQLSAQFQSTIVLCERMTQSPSKQTRGVS